MLQQTHLFDRIYERGSTYSINKVAYTHYTSASFVYVKVGVCVCVFVRTRVGMRVKRRRKVFSRRAYVVRSLIQTKHATRKMSLE